jgi:hypothetical protein
LKEHNDNPTDKDENNDDDEQNSLTFKEII